MSARPTFLVEEFSTVPLVEIVFALPAGSALDPKGKEGSLVLALRSLRRGAGNKSSTQLDDEIDRLGGELSTGCDALQCSLHATVISRNLEPFFALLADIAVRPTFNEEEVARVRREITAELIDARNDDRTLCGRYFRRTLFAGHPLGRPAAGTLSTVATLSRDDAKRAWTRVWNTKGLVIAAAGDITEERLAALWEKYFGDAWAPVHEKPAEVPEPKAPKKRTLIIVDKPARTQSQIMIGALGTHPRDKDHHALFVANTVFGGTFTSRLMREIRSKRGWSYGASSRLGRERIREVFSMWTFPKSSDAPACIAVELQLLEALHKGGITARELSFAKKYLKESAVFDTDTASKRLAQRLDETCGDMPKGYHDKFIPKTQEVTLEQCKRAIRARIDPDNLILCVTATASDLRAKLEAAIPELDSTTVIPFDRDEFYP
ncbi:MAG: pitrilysin family protein [Polyangiales bacterium]